MLHTPAGADADVDLTPTLLARSLGPALGAIVGDIHRDAGLPLHLGVGVHGWTETPSGVELTLDDGETLTADAAVVGTYPRTDLRRGSGLDLTDGVLCTPTCHAQTVDGKAVESVVAEMMSHGGPTCGSTPHHTAAGRTLDQRHRNGSSRRLTAPRLVPGRTAVHLDPKVLVPPARRPHPIPRNAHTRNRHDQSWTAHPRAGGSWPGSPDPAPEGPILVGAVAVGLILGLLAIEHSHLHVGASFAVGSSSRSRAVYECTGTTSPPQAEDIADNAPVAQPNRPSSR
ncbi:hypothetical protein FHU31_005316 [Mycolicibacterium fluoranthenivorans]|uniref:Uncharacterized protein n=1 Tax=Mycolicibacterium fluoranthenivorans TaxID=258505 RepID=A0A7X5U4S5_9MYCO|nr:hypothetical protein [Mycolicibacterium fluoranthenivorans]